MTWGWWLFIWVNIGMAWWTIWRSWRSRKSYERSNAELTAMLVECRELREKTRAVYVSVLERDVREH